MDERTKFIYIDLNALEGNKILLKGPILVKRILDVYGRCEAGMEIFLWTDDADKNNKYDPLVYTGKISYDKKRGEWFIEIDIDRLEHLSNSQRFKDFSIQDILGENYEKERKEHPELF